MSDYLQPILDHYGNPDHDRRGEYHVDCPFCGKEAMRGQTHFSFSESGYACFVCGSSGGLLALSKHLQLDNSQFIVTIRHQPRPKAMQPIARWRLNPDRLIDGYLSHPQRFSAWQQYKPVSRETIERHQFGYGRLPFLDNNGHWYMSRDNWLIVPLFQDGELVGLRGRNLTDQGPKWISATGTNYTLWGADNVAPGSVVWICENYVDAAWLMQLHPEWCAVAIGGATTWQAGWAQRLSECKPSKIVVALDNDLAGQATGRTLATLQAQWRVERPGMRIPDPNGPKIANCLIEHGSNAVLFRWPSDTPSKAGIDWVLRKELHEKSTG